MYYLHSQAAEHGHAAPKKARHGTAEGGKLTSVVDVRANFLSATRPPGSPPSNFRRSSRRTDRLRCWQDVDFQSKDDSSCRDDGNESRSRAGPRQRSTSGEDGESSRKIQACWGLAKVTRTNEVRIRDWCPPSSLDIVLMASGHLMQDLSPSSFRLERTSETTSATP
jgi:hypothetical protein